MRKEEYCVPDAIEKILALARAYSFTEAGVPLRAEHAYVTLGAALEQLPLAEGDGILVLSARPMLGGVLRSMLLAREVSRMAIFGVRSWTPEEYALAKANRVQVYSMTEASREGLSEVTDAVMTFMRSCSRFHVVLNLDVVDPAFAPGLLSPVPGGLTSRELLYVLQRLKLIKTLGNISIIADVSADELTCRLAAHVLAQARSP